MNGTTSSHRYEWYRPIPGESTNWLPPYAVHASTSTTTHAGASPPANSASTASGNVARKGERLCHMGTAPV